jgi:hypothetical protein
MKSRIVLGIIVLGIIVLAITIGLFFLFNISSKNQINKSSKKETSKDFSNHDSNSNKNKDINIFDNMTKNSDTLWLNISASKLNSVRFSMSGKLKKGDVPLKIGVFVKENDFLATLDLSNYFTELSQLKLSIRDELIELIGANPILQEPEAFIKWNGFLNDIDISKKLPEFPAIYNLEEEQIIRNSQIASLYITCRKLEQNAQNFFYLNKNEGYIWEVKKKIGDEVKANESFLTMARLDDLIFSSDKENNLNLNEKKFSLFDEKHQKIGVVNLLNNNELKFKLVKISNKSVSIDPKGKFYVIK